MGSATRSGYLSDKLSSMNRKAYSTTAKMSLCLAGIGAPAFIQSVGGIGPVVLSVLSELGWRGVASNNVILSYQLDWPQLLHLLSREVTHRFSLPQPGREGNEVKPTCDSRHLQLLVVPPSFVITYGR